MDLVPLLVAVLVGQAAQHVLDRLASELVELALAQFPHHRQHPGVDRLALRGAIGRRRLGTLEHPLGQHQQLVGTQVDAGEDALAQAQPLGHHAPRLGGRDQGRDLGDHLGAVLGHQAALDRQVADRGLDQRVAHPGVDRGEAQLAALAVRPHHPLVLDRQPVRPWQLLEQLFGRDGGGIDGRGAAGGTGGGGGIGGRHPPGQGQQEQRGGDQAVGGHAGTPVHGGRGQVPDLTALSIRSLPRAADACMPWPEAASFALPGR
ncbi:MAG: hypothetical protein L6R48_16365 [Planctomycetes bacterium]|nr:hypothetical protein [Planctomycetota bacterium]